MRSKALEKSRMKTLTVFFAVPFHLINGAQGLIDYESLRCFFVKRTVFHQFFIDRINQRSNQSFW